MSVPPPLLSRRGERLIARPPLPEYLHEHFARSAQAFDAKTRPDGYIPLCIAENKLISDFVLHKLSECHELPKDALGYDAMTGSLAVREALVDFMSKRFLGRRFAAEQIALLSGAGSVLEILFHVIADAGDGVLVPTPSYAGFWADLETRDELTIVPVHTSNADGFRLTAQLLDAALDKAPCPIRALLFTSPDNPTGRVYSESEIRSVLEWADRAGVHLVMDEIYALSVFGDKPFVSAARLLSTLGERVHLVWAFSKDFGMSGARVGVLVSENTALLRAVDALAYWACCSGPTQHLIARMLADEPWLDQYERVMRARLKQAYAAVTRVLTEANIPFVPSHAGFFLLLDLRRFLVEPSSRAEHALWRRILEEANVNLTPGAACRVAEPGFMRLCFAGVDTPTVEHAIRALARVLSSSTGDDQLK